MRPILISLLITITAGGSYTGPDGVERYCPEASCTMRVHREGYLAGRYAAGSPLPQQRRCWVWIGGTVAGVTGQTDGPDAVLIDGVRYEVREDGFLR